jgi:hypothetical protein
MYPPPRTTMKRKEKERNQREAVTSCLGVREALKYIIILMYHS